MENLLKPDIGLMFWTFVNFAVLVIVLAKIAWKPMLKILREREENIRQSTLSAETAKNDAQRMQAEMDMKLKNLSVKENEVIQNAKKLADEQRKKLLQEAKIKAGEILDKTKKDLLLEKEKLSAELKKQVADISIMAAQKIIAKEIDKKANKEFVERFLRDLSKKRTKNAEN